MLSFTAGANDVFFALKVVEVEMPPTLWICHVSQITSIR